ncbi:alpha/beta fold hydrolase [Burkholderia plantarii]|uniref:alpha/beta fold hydrolase n=1 Tax=Burkholderia plantarii TaxID=41899 RepID=UPI00272D9100|nr:alpha/beta fold hydrolase [Burkholderia plantarii]WLE61545.1 alpha/beta fold hydrolase [Burkholderia plantarii]
MDISTRGARIHVRVREPGQGQERDEPALVFLHYWGGSSRTWYAVAAELSDRYRTVAPDHRGWGDSSAPARGYAIADLADDAADVIEALGLREFVLVGHSMGGKVAQLLASRRPRGLRGLVLVAPSPPVATHLPDVERAALLAAYDTRESVAWVLDHVLTATRLAPALREQVIADSLRGAAPAREAWPNAAMREDLTAEVAAIDVPVCVIAGEHDRVDPVDTLRRALLPWIPGARLQVLPGVGHLSPLEAPREVAAAIGRFVEALAPSDDSGDSGDPGDPVACRTPEQVPVAFDAAFNDGDLDRLLDLFRDDAVMRMADGRTVAHGRDAIREQFAALLGAGASQILNRARPALVSGDVALVLLDWTMRTTQPDGRCADHHGTATQVMRRGSDGAWKLSISNPLGVAG